MTTVCPSAHAYLSLATLIVCLLSLGAVAGSMFVIRLESLKLASRVDELDRARELVEIKTDELHAAAERLETLAN